MKLLPTQSKRILLTLFWLWTLGIWIGSLMPMSGPSIENGDKIQHFIGYGVLALLAQLIWHQPRKIWLGATLMGVAVEFAQALTPYRSFDTHDMLANSIGAVFGLLLACAWLKRQ
ncbi:MULTISPECIES: VanZ family protein [Deefgea]|uniref:VanZ family protein n=1 Tax=Deefgea chitinilytica TaxID=570276 RepID=A0ABS2C9N4_9NEIS|nr:MULTISPECIES: VanZ family protein [Deefgea]MBM5570839.1 VanZ family protein [Deefgea chitinilytica]MBM9888068.1 VanZ family protein [Deefgea sp. CFH1-16]